MFCSQDYTRPIFSANSCACSKHNLVSSGRRNTELLVPSRSSFSWTMAGWEVCIKALYSAAMAPDAACICLSVYQVTYQANTQSWGLDLIPDAHYHKMISFRDICPQTYVHQLETEVSSLLKDKCKLRLKKKKAKNATFKLQQHFHIFPTKGILF